MSKSAIYTANNTLADVTDGSIVPLGTIIRRYGQNVRQDGNGITICDKTGCGGYYKVNVNATIETAAGGDVKIILEKDGVAVIGGVAEISPAPAATILPFDITVLVRNACGGTANLSVRLTGSDAKIINMTTIVEKL